MTDRIRDASSPPAGYAAAPVLSIAHSDALPDAAFSLVHARIEWLDAPASEGWGRDQDPALAEVKAIAEAVERAAQQRLPDAAFEACASELAAYIAPDSLVRYAAIQHADPAFPFPRFGVEDRRWWLPARHIGDERSTHVTADFVCHPRAFAPAYRERLLTHASSSGTASGSSIESAVAAAVLELVERDAFLRHWFAQRPGRAVDVRTMPHWAAQRVQTLTASGCMAGVQCLTLGQHPTWLAWAQHAGLHFTCVGSATGFDAERALRSALEELETFALARLGGVPDRAMVPAQVRSPADHGDLYATSAFFRSADRVLLGGEPVRFDAVEPDFRRTAGGLYDTLRRAGHGPAWVDMSLPAAAGALRGQPVYTVRALAPGLIPMAFGHGRMPLGMAGSLAEGRCQVHPFC